MRENAFARAIVMIRSGNGTASAIQAAATLVTEQIKGTIKKVVHYHHRNVLLNRIMEWDDMEQECVELVLTRVVNRYKFPEDLPDDYDRTAASFSAFARTVLVFYWRGKIRHIERNGTLQNVNEQSIGALIREGGSQHFVDQLTGGYEDEPDNDIVDVAKRRLHGVDRIIFSMRYDGKSTSQIGKVLGITRHSVQDRVRKKIRPVVEGILVSQGDA